MAEKLKCLHEKPVFGKKGRVIHPSLFLESDGRIVLTLRQIRRPAILRLVRRAVKLQSRWVCENLESLIDTRQLP